MSIYIHLFIGGSNLASLIGGEVVGGGRVVVVIKCVADWVPEGMVDGVTALMPDDAFVERDRF